MTSNLLWIEFLAHMSFGFTTSAPGSTSSTFSSPVHVPRGEEGGLLYQTGAGTRAYFGSRSKRQH